MKKFSLAISNKQFQVEVKTHPQDTQGEELLEISVNEQTYEVKLARAASPHTTLTPASSATETRPGTPQGRPQTPPEATQNELPILSPIPGLIVEILCQEGAQVTQGQTLLKIEAMKMENQLKSPKSGTITQILVTPGQEVKTKQLLIRLKAEA